ncbi:unnamed protein product [Mytilus edulis]|uniref:Uncharacterized protein n=1 Tax=Mytilus edulis TaxID=6550 RepID=A0A8S3TKN9_MYTED|nr:unnamed protein product [Mytilus edulis]
MKNQSLSSISPDKTYLQATNSLEKQTVFKKAKREVERNLINSRNTRFAANMSQTLEDLSLQFYQVLCNIVGSKDVVKSRRNLFTVMDFTFNDNEHVTTISSGSKAEGIDIKGSDYDQMVVYEAFRVFESINDEIYLPRKVPLLMDTNGTKLGFTKLKLFTKSHKKISEISEWSYTLGQDTYISSQLVKEYFLPPWTQIHGPCAAVPGDIYDCAMTYRCNEWIAPAQQWIARPRYTWPNALSNWLLLASFMYQHKRFLECIDIINHCVSQCTPDKIYSFFKKNVEEQTAFQKMKKTVGLILTCKHLMYQDVHFFHPFQLLPTELTTLPKSIFIVIIPPVVYSNVLLFLCFHHLRDGRGKLNTLRDLELTIREMYFIFRCADHFKTSKRCLDIVKTLI